MSDVHPKNADEVTFAHVLESWPQAPKTPLDWSVAIGRTLEQSETGEMTVDSLLGVVGDPELILKGVIEGASQGWWRISREYPPRGGTPSIQWIKPTYETDGQIRFRMYAEALDRAMAKKANQAGEMIR